MSGQVNYLSEVGNVDAGKVPLEDRLELWKFSAACASFYDAEQACAYYQRRDSGKKPDEYDLNERWRQVYSREIVVSYSRPFSQRPAVKLESELVPDQDAALHETLMNYRNKVVAHHDPDAGESFEGEEAELNEIQLVLRPSDVVSTMATVVFTRKQIDEILPLVRKMFKLASRRVEEILLRHDLKRIDDGTYRVNFTADGDWLEPVIVRTEK
jgi:hypothetical protein